MDSELENVLANLVRIGTVSVVDAAKKKARVIFKDKDNMTSGWLHVIQHYDAGVYIRPDGGHTHRITDTYMGGGSASAEPDHDHMRSNVTYWTPKINDTVLVIYLPVFNADGFILGAI